MTNESRTWRPARRRRIGVGFLALLTVMVLPGGVANAHTSFSGSTPADGATVAEPVSTITIAFTGDSEPVGDGFTLLMPHGHLRTPTSVLTVDQRVFTLTFDPPLAGGTIGVRWSVRAPDLHAITGAFSFTVTAGAPAGAAVAPTDTMVMADGSTMEGHTMTPDMSLDEFLATAPAQPGEGTARSGRIIEFAALTLLVGAVAFTATALRARQEEIERVISAVRVLGVVLAAGALLEYVGVARIAEESFTGYWSSSPGFATLSRVAAGAAIAVGFVAVSRPLRERRPARSLSAAMHTSTGTDRDELADFWTDSDRSGGFPRRQMPDRNAGDGQATTTMATTAATAGSVSTATVDPSTPTRPAMRRWVADQASWIGFAGIGLAVISFWFDGHTASKGFRPLHAVVNSVHVLAGAVWFGGVVTMAALLWSRHRAGVAPRALEMVLRFSKLAVVSLAALLVAGGVMAFLILDSFGELFSTEWGKVLVLKSAAVALALVGGAYNHLVLLSALEANPHDPGVVERIRATVTSEAILLGFVVIVTASLVSAAT